MKHEKINLSPHKSIGFFINSNEEKYYIGEHSKGFREGLGFMCYAKGSFCIGEWKNDKRNGFCIEFYCDGFIRGGQFEDDEMHGFGFTIHQDRSITFGEWVDYEYRVQEDAPNRILKSILQFVLKNSKYKYFKKFIIPKILNEESIKIADFSGDFHELQSSEIKAITTNFFQKWAKKMARLNNTIQHIKKPTLAYLFNPFNSYLLYFLYNHERRFLALFYYS